MLTLFVELLKSIDSALLKVKNSKIKGVILIFFDTQPYNVYVKHCKTIT